MEMFKMTCLEQAEMIKKGEISALELTDYYLERIGTLDPGVHAIVHLYPGDARREAAAKSVGPLAGVPLLLKDNICTKGQETTCASKALAGFKPPYDATVAIKLRRAGNVILGKGNMDEFGMGNTNETSALQLTRNPWNVRHVPGGSSGGVAAAVAAGLAPFAIGSDTGGSIRQPAAFCGVTGLKPTYGAVSRYGLIALGSSLDQIGPLAKTAADCAAVLDVIAGKDEMDATSMPTFLACLAEIDGGVQGLRIGIPKSYFGEGLDPEVKDKVPAAGKLLAELGAEVEEFDLGMAEYAVPAYYIISCAEASSNMSRYDGVQYGYRAEADSLRDLYLKSRSEGFGSQVKLRIMLGAFALSSGYYDAYYNKALQVKALIKREFDKAFERYDLILGPCAPTTAPEIGKNLADPLKMYLSDVYTVAANLAGLPGLSAPCGFDSRGLPIGMQLIGPAFQEARLLKTAHAYQMATDFHRQWPAIAKEGGKD